jgi:hypothetical protein
MKPDMNNWLTMLGARAMAQAGRETDQLEASRWGLIAAQAGVATHEFENGATWRMAEIAALQELISDAAASPLAGEFDPALLNAPTLDTDSLKISALDQRIEALRKSVSDLHAAVEGFSGDAARSLEQRLWTGVCSSVDRRTVPGNLFDQ